jgi:hypothetical protein
LIPYDCELYYCPGGNEENPADFTSRHPNLSGTEITNLAEECYECINAVPKAMTIQEVEIESQKGSTMQALIKAIETWDWSTREGQNYRKIKGELAVHKKLS